MRKREVSNEDKMRAEMVSALMGLALLVENDKKFSITELRIDNEEFSEARIGEFSIREARIVIECGGFLL